MYMKAKYGVTNYYTIQASVEYRALLCNLCFVPQSLLDGREDVRLPLFSLHVTQTLPCIRPCNNDKDHKKRPATKTVNTFLGTPRYNEKKEEDEEAI